MMDSICLYGDEITRAQARRAARNPEPRTRAYGRIVAALIERRGVMISYEELWELVLGDNAMETVISNVFYELEETDASLSAGEPNG